MSAENPTTMTMTDSAPGAGPSTSRPRPVSYTHLDVYKRQVKDYESKTVREAHV